jgi:hypothetical protein
MALHGFGPWPSIIAQVLDGPPGDAIRRLSTFLLIPVGSNRQGFAYVAANFQKIRSWIAQGAIAFATAKACIARYLRSEPI